ncbi:hypothetical protein [Aestuariibaculum lutulentum]|uniref:MotA/TolQ/ExbB proton channel domain-containing protein n=1 Tax=Aestuariibaculum lutulentum TaxID=2920935 RepID=A0ABS9RGY9_9FLAO|nr:hypothetical protein [Aestuariibaculum lutulentum]MCH4552208.1 hypothetical protein [Aestuariibaculum lutulentum]
MPLVLLKINLEALEYLIIGILVILQIYLAVRLYFKLNSYKQIFRKLPFVSQKQIPLELYNSGNVNDILFYKKLEDDFLDDDIYIDLTYIESSSNNVIINKISSRINSYLIKNKGASIDFHILKDVIDRNVEIAEEEINNRIPAPLYIGLAATMVGIILGLWRINFGSSGSNNIALDSIKPLIDGVKIAMSASVIGLFITTLFSVFFYKRAKSQVDEDKNSFLSLLQSELLPKMNKSKLPEVDVLSTKLDSFSRNTTGVVSKLDSIVKESSNAVFREQKLIEEIKTLDVKKVAKVNLDVFNKLEGMMDTFSKFSKHYRDLDKSLDNTNTLVISLGKFVSNTQHINDILESIKETIIRNNESTIFFNTHIESLSRYGDAVNEAVASTDSKMSKAIDELVESANKQFESFNEAIATYDSRLTKAFENSINKFTEVIDLHVQRTEVAFNSSRPKFEKLNELDRLQKLDALDKLADIDKRLISLEDKLSEVISHSNFKLIEALSYLNPQIKEMDSSLIEDNKNMKNIILNYVMTALKLTAYVVIISGGLYFIYLNI